MALFSLPDELTKSQIYLLLAVAKEMVSNNVKMQIQEIPTNIELNSNYDDIFENEDKPDNIHVVLYLNKIDDPNNPPRLLSDEEKEKVAKKFALKGLRSIKKYIKELGYTESQICKDLSILYTLTDVLFGHLDEKEPLSSIYEVAIKWDYEPSYFNNEFKRFFKITPAEARKRGELPDF